MNLLIIVKSTWSLCGVNTVLFEFWFCTRMFLHSVTKEKLGEGVSLKRISALNKLSSPS